MEVANINVSVREQRGRNRMRVVRMEGGLPAVLYGRGGENLSLTLPGHEFEKLVLSHHKLFELHFTDGQREEAYLHAMQWDAIRDELVHVDFRRIDLKEKMQVQVELRFVGNPKGLSKNGVFDAPLKMLDVECLPADLPESIRLNTNDLDLGDHVYVKDLTMPKGVTALTDPEAIVCLVKLAAGGDAEAGEAEEGAEPEVIGKGGDSGDSDD
ncbi:MAG: 50S ribosomal protein L25 [Planctomycetes bacterium]|nr:50S ribosomal protein L25 [Planctomycetota bacterium]MCB9916895.1 50S ribosomal protein L25 [Planctomycetota bacterium]